MLSGIAIRHWDFWISSLEKAWLFGCVFVYFSETSLDRCRASLSGVLFKDKPRGTEH